MAMRIHPFPSRTRKLSSFTSKILGWRRPGKIDRCRHKFSSLAQSVEHSAVNRVVARSSRAGGAKTKSTPNGVLFVLLFLAVLPQIFKSGTLTEVLEHGDITKGEALTLKVGKDGIVYEKTEHGSYCI